MKEMKKKQHAFVDECANEHWDDIIEAIENGHRYAATTIDNIINQLESRTETCNNLGNKQK